MTHKIFIDGAVGTTGLEINQRLAGRADLEMITLDESQRKDDAARREALNASDLVILCLPDDAARAAVSLIENPDTRVIDASTAHRVASNWVYGFAEVIGHHAVVQAMRVSNPGCYATGFIALIAPLVRAGLIAPNAPLTCNAVSGYSGGGKAMIAEFEGAKAPTAWRSYALGLAHKHVPEMQHHSGLSVPPLFAPAVVNSHRGMIVDVPLFGIDADEVKDVLRKAYERSTIVRLNTENPDDLTVEHAAHSDRLELFTFSNGQQTRLVAALDNLGKGAAGAAVQNLNIMLGLDETTGLRV